MKSRILILLSTLLLTLSVHAQPGGGQGRGAGMMNPEARVAELIATLEITPQQEPAFREAMAKIAEQQMAAMQALRQGGGGNGGGQGQGQGMARRAEMERMTEETLSAVLTESQMARFREAEAARMEEMRQRMMQRQQ
ncbi:MAG: hypothetical protein Q8L60_00610 [Gammaproteobacteria bacterium]|nr:hypothetical protein [Gammaproteobacteria bacterium]MDP2141608.1 hypothetical protein [Gammaproteobacteria bacterium]MDP2346637.1 hypothetical protein [Gammaproteobacteria bacterium]